MASETPEPTTPRDELTVTVPSTDTRRDDSGKRYVPGGAGLRGYPPRSRMLPLPRCYSRCEPDLRGARHEQPAPYILFACRVASER